MNALEETLASVQPQGQPAGNALEATLAGLQMAPQQAPAQGFWSSLGQHAINLGAGAVRGAGSIGATMMAPVDVASDLYNGKGLTLDSNRTRRSDMDEGLQALTGADPNSLMYRGGQVIGEVAGTAGAGGVLANGLTRAAPGASALAQALRTGGISANGAGMPTRILGGAATGAASAGMVNPEEAGMGAVVGGVAAPVVKGVATAADAVGEKLGQRLANEVSKYNAGAPLRDTVSQSLDAGYLIPPNMVKPGFVNQTIESVSGKQATQQIASTKNTEVTNKLVRQSLGMAEDAPLTVGALENIRKQAGTAYRDVASLSPQAATDLEALKQARNDSQAWFKAYNRSASPEDLAKAKQFGATATDLEQAMEKHAADAGKPELIPALRDARTQIAKTYTVQRALNDATGTVDARVLGRMYEKGSPLSDGLDVAGKFASAFPTIAKSPQTVGSPAAHNMKAIAAALMSGGGAAAAGPFGSVLGAVPFAGPPLARSLMFRKAAQQGLVDAPPQSGYAQQLAKLLSDPEAMQLFSRAAPVLATGAQP